MLKVHVARSAAWTSGILLFPFVNFIQKGRQNLSFEATRFIDSRDCRPQGLDDTLFVSIVVLVYMELGEYLLDSPFRCIILSRVILLHSLGTT